MRCGSVARSIVDDEYLEVGVLLAEHAGERSRQ
jgi:hypothetical protein